MESGADWLRPVLTELENALSALLALHNQGVDVSGLVLGISRALERLEDLLPDDDSGPRVLALWPEIKAGWPPKVH